MPTLFDPKDIELSTFNADVSIDVYKIGGGTPGKRYVGFWGYKIKQVGVPDASGTDLHTGTPHSHYEVAELVRSIFVVQTPAHAGLSPERSIE